mmetsp:Transcript_16598/g.16689  ORF Transcript_16598/g.16689 Transcript_16598/m.16689 type:complete len:183 (+) Transcript_16598:89-637(+)
MSEAGDTDINQHKKRDFRMEIEFVLNSDEATLARDCESNKSDEKGEDHEESKSHPSDEGKPSKTYTKSPWSQEENEQLESLVARYGPRRWSFLASLFSNRSAGQLRSHWKHCLEVKDSKRPFTPEEDAFILSEFESIGTKWTLIAQKMDRRCDIDVKNRFQCITRTQRKSQPQNTASPNTQE